MTTEAKPKASNGLDPVLSEVELLRCYVARLGQRIIDAQDQLADLKYLRARLNEVERKLAHFEKGPTDLEDRIAELERHTGRPRAAKPAGQSPGRAGICTGKEGPCRRCGERTFVRDLDAPLLCKSCQWPPAELERLVQIDPTSLTTGGASTVTSEIVPNICARCLGEPATRPLGGLRLCEACYHRQHDDRRSGRL